jgi:TPR repeat protein
VQLDLVRAHKYFNLAAMKGVTEARLWRAELAQQMTSNDIAEAQRLARLWLQETAH